MSGFTHAAPVSKKSAFSHSNFLYRRVAIPNLPAGVQEVLRSSGQPLDEKTREFMEPRFGHDFGSVRIHNDSRAIKSAQALNAQAYTVGNNVVFSENKFASASDQGRELLAHELAHTIQQRRTNEAGPSADPNGIFEISARTAAQNIIRGKNVDLELPRCGIGLSCSLKDDDEAKRRAAAVAEAQAVLAQKDQTEDEDDEPAMTPMALGGVPYKAKPAVAKKAKRPQPDLSRFAPGGFKDEYIYGGIDAKKKTDDDAQKAAQQKEDENRDVRLMALRERLRHGFSRSVLADMLDTLPMRDLQILKRYGFKWTWRGPDQDSLVEAIDKWAASSDTNTPDPKQYSGIVQSEKKFYQRNYANLQNYNHRVEALASSGPASLAGRAIGTAIGGEKGGDWGAAIGGLGDAALPVIAGMMAPESGTDNEASGNFSDETTAGIYGDPPAAADRAETQPDAVGGATANASPTISPTVPVAVTDAEVVASNVKNPASVKIQDPTTHEKTWHDLGGAGDAPAAFRDGEGNVHISTNHRLTQPATRNVVPPESRTNNNATKPISSSAKPTPVKTSSSPKDEIEMAKTGQASVQPAADPLAKTPKASPPPAAAKLGTADTSPKGEATFDPPQAVSEEVVQKMQNQPRPVSARQNKGRGNNVHYTIDHDHQQLAWQRLGGHGDAPDAFIYNGQVYLDPLRWPPKK